MECFYKNTSGLGVQKILIFCKLYNVNQSTHFLPFYNHITCTVLEILAVSTSRTTQGNHTKAVKDHTSHQLLSHI